MTAVNEDESELLIEEHLRAQGWNLADFTLTENAGADISTVRRQTEFSFTMEKSAPSSGQGA